MIVRTSQFGEIRIDENQVIRFAQGLAGFEDETEYAIVETEEELPFSFLQSARDEQLTFVIMNPFLFFKDYEFQLPQSVQDELEIQSQKEVSVWSVVSIRSNIEDSTCNLLAPIVINVNNKRAKQVILHGSAYKTKHPLFSSPDAESDERGNEHARVISQEG